MKELRICEIRAEAAAGAEALKLEGMPIVYDQPTTINDPKGQFIEIIRSGALDGADLTDCRLLYNHDLNKVPLARTPKTMQFTKSAAGLKMIASLPDTPEARSVHTAVLRGDLSGMSFAFKVPKGGDRYDPKTNTREILKIEKVYEVSVVPFPAYPQTSVEARATMQPQRNQAKKQAIIMANKILMKEV
ncbi:MAG: HK97 family phage prohead protease [Clostridia bacterium]|nr:HK97 family phage prohead protease [Clostridia bacterium]